MWLLPPESSLERKFIASLKHPWPQYRAKIAEMHQTESGAM